MGNPNKPTTYNKVIDLAAKRKEREESNVTDLTTYGQNKESRERWDEWRKSPDGANTDNVIYAFPKEWCPEEETVATKEVAPAVSVDPEILKVYALLFELVKEDVKLGIGVRFWDYLNLVTALMGTHMIDSLDAAEEEFEEIAAGLSSGDRSQTVTRTYKSPQETSSVK